MTERTPSVIVVSQTFPPEKGGNASRIHDTAMHLESEGWDVTVLSPPPCYPPGTFDRTWRRTTRQTVDGVEVIRLWSWQPTQEDPGFLSRLAYYIGFAVHALVWLLWNYRRYDLVVTSTPPISTGGAALPVALLGKPWLVDVRDLWIDNSVSLGYIREGGLIERMSRRFQRTVLHCADRIAVTTATLGEQLAKHYGPGLRERTVVIPNGVDTEEFEPQEVDADGHATETPPIIIYTGNLGHAQDLESVIRAVPLLSHDRAVLKLIGGGDNESYLRRLANELGVADRIEFGGVVPRDRIPEYLNEATVGVAPLEDTEELSYAMPTKVYEYSACRLPVVVTGRGEIERFVEESGGGVHVVNDPERIAERLDELLTDRDSRTELAARAHEHVRSNYDRGQIAERLSKELTTLLSDQSSIHRKQR